MIKTSIGDILELKRGYDLTKKEMSDGNVPVVGSNGIIGYHNQSTSSVPCLTIGRSGTVGIPHIYKEPCWVHNTALYVSDFKGNNPYYLYYLLKNVSLDKVSSSTGVPTLNRNFVHPLKVLYEEDLRTQEKIASLFVEIDTKIELNNQIIHELEELSKTIYNYWFLQYEFPNEEGKPYKSSGGKMVWNEKLKREIPEGWEAKKYCDIASTVTGKEDANFATENGQYAYFTCGTDVLKCDEYKFDGKAILIAGNGDFNVKYYDGKFNAYQRTYVLMPEEKYVGILYQVATRTISRFKSASNGSIVKFITKRDIDEIEMLIPRDEELLKPFNSILEIIQANKKQNQELASLRDWLLPMLMNGQVTFKEEYDV